MVSKLKRKYLINGKEFYAIDSLEEFMNLFNTKYNKTNNVVDILHKFASELKDEKDLNFIEEVITKYVLYNLEAGIYKENNKSYHSHNIITYKMPKDLEKSILNSNLDQTSKKETKNFEPEQS